MTGNSRSLINLSRKGRQHMPSGRKEIRCSRGNPFANHQKERERDHHVRRWLLSVCKAELISLNFQESFGPLNV